MQSLLKFKGPSFRFCASSQPASNPFHQFIKNKQSFDKMYTPKRIVQYLDQHVIGQNDAKKAVAISLRNRWRRKMLPEGIKQEVVPKNILISGPTGCGKTQIARRLAKLTQSPFIRVEATKFTQVGYIGKDVSSIIEDLAKIGLNEIKRIHQEMKDSQKMDVEDMVFNDLADALLGKQWHDPVVRTKKISDLKEGKYKKMSITVYPKQLKLWPHAPENSFLTATVEEIQYSLFQIYKQRERIQEKSVNLQKQAIKKVEEEGIIFLDEIDKLALTDKSASSRAISRQGVQRDLLPIIQGTTIGTKIGDIRTDNILFIASGAFSMSSTDDLIPQLLGRLPIRVSMNPLTQEQLYRILVEPKYNLLMQQKNLLAQQKIDIQFTDSSVSQMARFASEMNKNHENMGARRLQSITQKIIQDISFQANQHKGTKIVIDDKFVQQKCKGWDQKIFLAKYLI